MLTKEMLQLDVHPGISGQLLGLHVKTLSKESQSIESSKPPSFASTNAPSDPGVDSVGPVGQVKLVQLVPGPTKKPPVIMHRGSSHSKQVLLKQQPPLLPFPGSPVVPVVPVLPVVNVGQVKLVQLVPGPRKKPPVIMHSSSSHTRQVLLIQQPPLLPFLPVVPVVPVVPDTSNKQQKKNQAKRRLLYRLFQWFQLCQ